MENVGAMLRRIRKEAGYTQERLGEALGYGHAYISRIESGRLRPSWWFLTKFADLLHVPIADLLKAAGLVAQPTVDEVHIAEMIAARPKLVEVFEYARQTGDSRVLADLERFAGMLLKELERDEQGEVTSATDWATRG